MLERLLIEKELYSKGFKYIAGVDEVGRGPLAGPFVVCAVILDIEKLLQNEYPIDKEYGLYSKIKDSKKVTEINRTLISSFLLSEHINYSIVEVHPTELDEMGISKATQYAFYRAVNTLGITPDHILTDSFEIKNINKEIQTNIIRGDDKSITIGAASIIAKVHRDNIMLEEHNKYPEYGFDAHKGYGTKGHLEAIEKHGICDIHRKSFEPIKSIIAKGIISK